MSSTQIAVRLDDEALERLDWLVVRCDFENRAEAVRAALSDLAERERQREIGEQIAEGYLRVPATSEQTGRVDGRIARGLFPGLPDDDWDDWF